MKGIVNCLKTLMARTDILPASGVLLAVGVVFAQTQTGINFESLNRILAAGACAVRALGPWLALLLLAIAGVLVIVGSGRAITYGAGALIGLALVAGVPQLLASVASMFGFNIGTQCP
jgi:hypothetical protein